MGEPAPACAVLAAARRQRGDLQLCAYFAAGATATAKHDCRVMYLLAGT